MPSLAPGSVGYIGISPRTSEAKEDTTETLRDISEKVGSMAVGPVNGGVASNWSLTTLREKLIKIGAKVVTHARYVIFQMAEGTICSHLTPRPLRVNCRAQSCCAANENIPSSSEKDLDRVMD